MRNVDNGSLIPHFHRLAAEKSIEDAIQNAITRASKTIRNMKWFEVEQTRGHIENGSVRHYQVTLRVGFTLARGVIVGKHPRPGPVAELVGIEGGVVSGVINLESSGVEASDQAPALRHAS